MHSTAQHNFISFAFWLQKVQRAVVLSSINALAERIKRISDKHEINFCVARDTPIFCLNSSLNTTSKLPTISNILFYILICAAAAATLVCDDDIAELGGVSRARRIHTHTFPKRQRKHTTTTISRRKCFASESLIRRGECCGTKRAMRQSVGIRALCCVRVLLLRRVQILNVRTWLGIRLRLFSELEIRVF